MGTTVANYGEWDFLYLNALLEPDGNRLPERITAAVAAINLHLQEMANGPGDNAERFALIDALGALQLSRLAEVGRRIQSLTEPRPKVTGLEVR